MAGQQRLSNARVVNQDDSKMHTLNNSVIVLDQPEFESLTIYSADCLQALIEKWLNEYGAKLCDKSLIPYWYTPGQVITVQFVVELCMKHKYVQLVGQNTDHPITIYIKEIEKI